MSIFGICFILLITVIQNSFLNYKRDVYSSVLIDLIFYSKTLKYFFQASQSRSAFVRCKLFRYQYSTCSITSIQDKLELFEMIS